MLQDKWPWTLPLAGSFLKGRGRMSQGGKVLTSYSEDSDLDSASLTSVSVSKASTAREQQDKEQDGTFDRHLN